MLNFIKNTGGISSKIRLIIVLMVLTIGGVIAFQINWLNTSYKIWEEQFDADVRESITTAVEKGLKGEFVEYTIKLNLPGISDVAVFSKDSVLQNDNYFIEIKDSNIISEKTFNEIQVILDKSDSVKKEVKSANRIRQVIVNEHEKDIQIYKDSIIYNTSIDTFSSSETMQYSVVVHDNIDTIIETSYTDNKGFNEDLYIGFINALNSELKLRNIDIEYNVGIYNINKSKFEYIYPEDVDTAVFESAYKVPVFNKLTNPDYAGIYFPSKNTHLFLQLLPSVLASLILIIITVFSFGYILSTIYSQKKLSEIKNDFINNMTHELKTPITTVSLAIEAIKDFNVLDDKEQTEKYLSIAAGENKRLSLLVDRILKIAAYQREEIKLNIELVDLHAVIINVVQNIDIQVENKKGRIFTDFKAIRYSSLVDKVHFSNLIFNLLDNAIKYSDQTPEINITTIDIDNGIMISVKDNGIGINRQFQERIFDKFFRVPTGNIHKIKGHGLGLSYVKETVEMHGGKIDIKSEEGKGSDFHLSTNKRLMINGIQAKSTYCRG